MNLAELVLEFSANTAPLEATFNQAVAKARTAANQIDQVLSRSYGKGAGLDKNLIPKIDTNQIQRAISDVDKLKKSIKSALPSSSLFSMDESSSPTLRNTKGAGVGGVQPNEVKSVGADITAGLSQGINFKIDEVKSAGRRIGKAVIIGAKDELEIKSPSRVFAQIGHQIVAGLTSGMGGAGAVLIPFLDNIFDLDDAIIELGQSTFETALDFERLKVALDFSTQGRGIETLERLREESNRLGVSFKESARGYQQFRAATTGTTLEGQTDEIYGGFQEAISTQALSPQQAESVNRAISQMTSKGRTSLEELTQQLGEALPNALNAAAKGMGVSTAELIKMVENGNVLSQNLLPRLSAQLSLESQSGLAATANTAQAKLNKLNNEIQHSQEIIGGFTMGAAKPAIDAVAKGLEFFNNNSAVASRASAVLAGFIGINVVKALAGVAIKLGLVTMLMKAFGLSGLNLQGVLLNLPALASSFFKALLVPAAVTAGLELLFASLNRDSQKLKDINAALETSIRNIEEAYTKAGNAAADFNNKAKPKPTEPQAENPILRFADDFVVNPVNRVIDFLNQTPQETFGGSRPTSAPKERVRLRTSGVAAQEDNLVLISEKLLGVNDALNKTGLRLNDSKFLAKTVEQLKAVDLQILRIQAKQNVVRLEGSTEEVQKLQKELDKLQNNRKSVLETVFGNRGDLENFKKQLEAERDEINRMISVGSLSKDAVAPSIALINQLLKETERQMGAVANVTKQTAAALDNMKVKVASINAAFENTQYQADLNLNVTKTEILLSQGTGSLGENAARRATTLAEQESYKKRLRHLEDFTRQYQALIEQLSIGERIALESYLGVGIESAGVGDIKRVNDLYEDKITGNQKAILEARQKMLDLQKEVGTAAQGIAQGAVELQTALRETQEEARNLRSSAKDFVREYGDFLRGIANQTKEAALDIQGLKNQIRGNDFKSELLRALTKTSRGIFGTINDVMIRYLEEAQQITQQALDRQRQQMQSQNQLIDLSQQNLQQGRQYQDLGRQINRYNQSNAGVYEGPFGAAPFDFAQGTGVGVGTGNNSNNGSPAVNTTPYTVYSGGRAVTTASAVNEHHDGRAYHRDHFHGKSERFRGDGGFSRLVKDIVLAQGNNQAVSVPSPAAGILRLKSAFQSGGYGNLAEILNPLGQVVARLAHLARFEPGLRSGQQVSYGQSVGIQGNTGRSTGTHLHLELPPQLFDKYFKDLRSGSFAPVGRTVGSNETGGVNGITTAMTRLLHIIAAGESEFNSKASNSIGARGAFQFIPGTRQRAIQRTGKDPWAGDIQQQASVSADWIKSAHPQAYAATQKGDLGRAIALLRREWTSLPGAAESKKWGGSEGQARLQQYMSGNFTPRFSVGGSGGGAGIAPNARSMSKGTAQSFPQVILPNVDLNMGNEAISRYQKGQTEVTRLNQQIQQQSLKQFKTNFYKDIAAAIEQRSQAYKQQQMSLRDLREQRSDLKQQYQPESIANTLVKEIANIERSYRGQRETYEKESIDLQKNIAGGEELLKILPKQIEQFRLQGTPLASTQAEGREMALKDIQESLPKYKQELADIRKEHAQLKGEAQEAINFKVAETLRKASVEGSDSLRSLQRSMRDAVQGYKDLNAQFQAPSFTKELEKSLTDVDRQFEHFSDGLGDKSVELTRTIQGLELQLADTAKELNQMVNRGDVSAYALVQQLDQQQAQLAAARAALAQNQATSGALPYNQREAKLFTRLSVTKQNRQEREQQLGDYSANLLETRAKSGMPRFLNAAEIAKMEAAAATIRENLRFKIEMEGFSELAAKLNLTAEQAATLNSQMAEINQVNLGGIRATESRGVRLSRQEGEQFWVDTKANTLERRASRPGLDEYSAARLQAESATVRENLRFKVEMEGFPELATQMNLTALESALLKGKLTEINQINLEGIREQADLLSTQIRDGLKSSFSSLFTDIFSGSKSAGAAFADFGRGILGTIAQLFAQQAAFRLTKSIFGIFGGAFQDGGTVKNYATGGTIANYALRGYSAPTALGLSVMDAMKREGAGAVPIVASRGEEVLSTRNSDAQFYRILKRSNLWDEMKQSHHVQNFALGGMVGSSSNDATPRFRAGQRVPTGDTNVTVNMNITTTDANSFRRSEGQMARDSAFAARRAYERNS